MSDLKQHVEEELRSNILPFWLKYAVDDEFGGFRGQITNDLIIDANAHKGLILNARILWTFSKAYSVYHEDIHLQTARRAYDYIVCRFWDSEFWGMYWMLDHLGLPVDTKKRVHGQAFSVYSLAEYYIATKDTEAPQRAILLYELIEPTRHDSQRSAYLETYERDWTLASDQRLSEADMDEKKSLNTHLHVLEAYANLLRAWNNAGLKARLGGLIEVFLNHIIDSKKSSFSFVFR